MKKICSECGFEIKNDLFRCENCGHPIKKIICSECQQEIAEDDNVCRNCGCPLVDSKLENHTKFRFSSKSMILVICLFSLFMIGIATFNISKNNFKEELVSSISWTESKYCFIVSFSEDGIFKYYKTDWQGIENGLNYSIGVAEYKVVSKNNVKIGNQNVKIDIKNDGSLHFEPDFKKIILKLDDSIEEK